MTLLGQREAISTEAFLRNEVFAPRQRDLEALSASAEPMTTEEYMYALFRQKAKEGQQGMPKRVVTEQQKTVERAPQTGPDVSADLTPDDVQRTEHVCFYTYAHESDWQNNQAHRENVGREGGQLTTTGVLATLTITRNQEGQIVRKTEATPAGVNVSSYGYDVDGRLVQRIARTGEGHELTETYTYNALGQRTSFGCNGLLADEYYYDAFGKIVRCGNTAYTYDHLGRIFENISPAGTTRYSYDAMGNLVSVILEDGRCVEYVCDAAGRRTSKSVNGECVERYAWHNSTVLAALSNSDNSTQYHFVYEENSRTPVCMIADGEVFSIASDQVGTPYAVANSIGELLQGNLYDAFGKKLDGNASAIRFPIGFGGGLYDPDTGLVHLRHREYDPTIGRFIQPDPLGYAGGDIDVYGYCLDDPVNLLDPSGLAPEEAQTPSQAPEGGSENNTAKSDGDTKETVPSPDGSDNEAAATSGKQSAEGTGETANVPTPEAGEGTEKNGPDITESGEEIPDVPPEKQEPYREPLPPGAAYEKGGIYYNSQGHVVGEKGLQSPLVSPVDIIIGGVGAVTKIAGKAATKVVGKAASAAAKGAVKAGQNTTKAAAKAAQNTLKAGTGAAANALQHPDKINKVAEGADGFFSPMPGGSTTQQVGAAGRAVFDHYYEKGMK